MYRCVNVWVCECMRFVMCGCVYVGLYITCGRVNDVGFVMCACVYVGLYIMCGCVNDVGFVLCGYV